MKTTIKLLAFILIFTVFVSACSNFSAEATPTPRPAVDDDYIPVISATGKVVPAEWATLSVQAGGVVAEVLVEEGKMVEAGQVLLRLEGEEDAQAIIATAQLELATAQNALDDLLDQDYELLAAQARQQMDEAQKTLDDLNNSELQQALALQAIAEVEKAVEDAGREVSRVKSTANQADIDAAKAAVILAEDALEKAKDDFEPYANKPEDNLARANLQARLSAAQQAYDATVRRLNALESTGDPLDIAIAEARLATAQAQLIQAKQDWEEIKDGPDPGNIALLEAQIANFEREWNRLEDGPDPDDVTLAEARIANAKAQLAAAEAALDKLVLTAPFEGTVSDIFIHDSEWIAPGQPVILLADLSHLQVETTDLNEIDVAQVSVGKTAIVTFDALPELTVTGTVVHIAPKSAEGAGVNYTVTLEMEEIPDGLRWGMTAFIDIKTE